MPNLLTVRRAGYAMGGNVSSEARQGIGSARVCHRKRTAHHRWPIRSSSLLSHLSFRLRLFRQFVKSPYTRVLDNDGDTRFRRTIRSTRQRFNFERRVPKRAESSLGREVKCLAVECKPKNVPNLMTLLWLEFN